MTTARPSTSGDSRTTMVARDAASDRLRAIESHYERSAFVARACLIPGSSPAGTDAPRHLWVYPDADALRARRTVSVRDLLRFEIETLGVSLPASQRATGFDVSLERLRGPSDCDCRAQAQEQFEARLARRVHEPARALGAAGRHATLLGDDDAARAAALALASRRPHRVLEPATHLDLDLELESIERVEVLLEASCIAGVTLPRERMWQIATAGDLAGALRQAPRRVQADCADGDPWRTLLRDRPPEDAQAASLERSQAVRATFAYCALRLGRLTLKPFLRLCVSGREHLPDRGPYLLAVNHQSYIDGFLVCSVLPHRAMRSIFIVGAPEYFATPWLARLASTFSLVPVDPDANLVGALQTAAVGLRTGRVLLIFPEGERSIGGELVVFRRGTALLASRLQVPIVPVAIDGAHEVWPRGLGLAWKRLRPGRRPTIHIRFGPVITPEGGTGPEADLRLTARLRTSIGTMREEMRR